MNRNGLISRKYAAALAVAIAPFAMIGQAEAVCTLATSSVSPLTKTTVKLHWLDLQPERHHRLRRP